MSFLAGLFNHCYSIFAIAIPVLIDCLEYDSLLSHEMTLECLKESWVHASKLGLGDEYSGCNAGQLAVVYGILGLLGFRNRHSKVEAQRN